MLQGGPPATRAFTDKQKSKERKISSNNKSSDRNVDVSCLKKWHCKMYFIMKNVKGVTLLSLYNSDDLLLKNLRKSFLDSVFCPYWKYNLLYKNGLVLCFLSRVLFCGAHDENICSGRPCAGLSFPVLVCGFHVFFSLLQIPFQDTVFMFFFGCLLEIEPFSQHTLNPVGHKEPKTNERHTTWLERCLI